MRPYGVRMSHRPGCACCNSKHLHHFRGVRMSANAGRAKRTAKKIARAAGREECKLRQENIGE